MHFLKNVFVPCVEHPAPPTSITRGFRRSSEAISERRLANAGVYLHIHMDSLIRDNGERPRSSADMFANAVLHIQNIDARG